MAVEAPDRTESKTSNPPTKDTGYWLVWLSAFIKDRHWLGMVEFVKESDLGTLVASYPEKVKAPPAAMLVARKAKAANRATSVRIPQGPQEVPTGAAKADPSMSLLAVPLPGNKRRVVLLFGPAQAFDQQTSTATLCRWAGVWLSRGTPDLAVERAVDKSPSSLAESVLNAAYEHQTPEAIARAMVNTVKRLCGCARVSLAIQRKPSVQSLDLIAISDQAAIDVRKVLPAQIIAAMEESLYLQTHSASVAPQVVSQLLTDSAASVLFREQGEHPALFVWYPSAHEAATSLSKCALTRIVVTLERPCGQEFEDAQVQAINLALNAPLDMLARQFDQRMSTWNREIQRWHLLADRQSLSAVTYRHRWKLMMAAFFAGSLLIPVPHRISAHAAIEARDQQVLIAAQDGFVSTSHVRAGDIVIKNQLLATLDTQDLNLSAGKWRSESAKNTQAVQQALATKDRVSLGRLRADAARISAEMELVERQIARSELRAPFDGVVLSGDLHQQLGAAVTRGEALFTVAASDEYRLVLELQEQDVGLVRTGQPAEVRLSALPNSTWDATIDAVLPVAVTTEEKHVFRVPANLSERSDALLPGMEGVARLQVGSQSLAWVYTRALREKVRLLLWRTGIIQ